MSKVSVIGAGNVGATAAYFIAEKNIADIVMVDVVKGLAESKALDYLNASPLQRLGTAIVGTSSYEGIEGSDLVVMTAGVPRKPGMDRMDLLKTNVDIAQKTSQAIKRFAPNSIVIVVTNPLDIIAMVVLRETGFAPHRVIGMAGVLDSTRFCYFIAEKLGIWPGDVRAMVLGGHGDQMVPLPRFTSVGGFPLTEFLDSQSIEALVDRTRKGGAEIVNHLKRGSAFFSPGASAAKMVEAVVTGKRRILAASAYLSGEYGFKDIFLGVPIVLGKEGVEKILVLDLKEDEQAALDKSAQAVKMGLASLSRVY